jgi:hypothetical protein
MSTKCVIDSVVSSLQGCQDGKPAKAGHRPQSHHPHLQPALDIIKKLYSNTRAAKRGFVVRPVLKHTVVLRTAADGSTIEERVRVWDHSSTADWWHRMQAEVSTRQMHLYDTVRYTCLSSKHAIQS